LLDATPPKSTPAPLAKPLPKIVTVVPPADDPLAGSRLLTDGAIAYANSSELVTAEVPPAVVTVTSTVPALPAGDTAVIEVGELTTTLVAAPEPNWTVAGLAKLGEHTWQVIAAGAQAGHDVRVGLEDVLVLPDGQTAADNAELVACAAELIGRGR
jgi:hypothetical protein